MSSTDAIPIVDVTPLLRSGADRRPVADAIGRACRESGFFYVSGHGVAPELIGRLEDRSREFFALDDQSKLAIRMVRGGRAWRGYFPVGGELTSGEPDRKEGLYFGAELPADHPKVRAGVPLHGPNLFPEVDGFRQTVIEYLDVMTALGHALMEGIALSLGLDARTFADHYGRDPLILFRVFHYPPLTSADADAFGVGEHTDYGVLTILLQDDTGGLQIRRGDRWFDAPPIPETFVCNIGDMLERMTGGLYRSTPHRVRNTSGRGRLSFPFFFDPAFDAEVRALDTSAVPAQDADDRWDHQNVHTFTGTYGEYLLQKVARVFPELGEDVL